MKKLVFAFLLMAAVSVKATAPVEVNEKVLKAFKETFTRAEDVVWHEQDNVYQANFWQNNINIRAVYDEGGNLLQTIRYYFERQLPPNILARLKKKYDNRSVYGVTEITSDNEISYYITMEDSHNWYTVKSDAYGNMEQTEKMKKADPK
ncbi:MAG TPA: hypothetical protein VFS36_02995 [Chitinophagaceae bacterium]|jgi:hypothetical protein|nr:hypothetical protein [Chitinophagaceae bacterium]